MSFEAVQKVSFQKVFKSLFFRKLNKSTIIIFLFFFFYFTAPFYNLTVLEVTSTLARIKFFLSFVKNTFQNNRVSYEKICIAKKPLCGSDVSCQKVNIDATAVFPNLKAYCVYTFVGHFKTEMDLKWVNLTTPAVEVKTLSSSRFCFNFNKNVIILL